VECPRRGFQQPHGVLLGGKGREDLFLPITSNYKFCGYDILPDFGVFDVFKNPAIPPALQDYRRHLDQHSLGPQAGR
jgi:modulator of drug activity B